MRPAAVLFFLAAFATVSAQPPARRVTVTGRVVLPAGAPVPEAKAHKVSFDRQHCGEAIPDETVVVDPKTRGVRDVVVWLRPDDPDPKATLGPTDLPPGDTKRKPAEVVIELKGCRFVPHVATARAGDTLVYRYIDPVAHNPFIGDGEWRMTVPAIPQKGEWRFPVVSPAVANPVLVRCTIHPWMSSYLRVFDHPYHAVTDAEGRFTIRDTPAGKYRLVYWHPDVGLRGGKDGRAGEPVTLAAGPDGTQTLPPTPFDITK